MLERKLIQRLVRKRSDVGLRDNVSLRKSKENVHSQYSECNNEVKRATRKDKRDFAEGMTEYAEKTA